MNEEYITKTINIDGTRITLQRPVTPKKEDIINFYDVVNDIARNLEKKGVDTSDLFYTDEEIKTMERSGKYKFI